MHSTFDSLRAGEASGAYARALAQLVRLARDAKVPILIEGESGTGKTFLARQLHDRSPRRGRPFRLVSLAAIEDSLCASELFGHEPGAFTDASRRRAGHFASANGGTLFLDEIGRTSLHVQQRLLHVLEYGTFFPLGSDREAVVDVRVIAATNRPLAELVAEHCFLPDLHARLELFRVVVPALRERRAEIPALVQIMLETLCREVQLPQVPRIHPDLMCALRGAPWPHNLRQLNATLRRLVIDADGATEITLGDCHGDLAYLRSCAYREGMTLTRERAERALQDAGANKSKAARLLGVDRTTLNRNLRRWGREGNAGQ